MSFATAFALLATPFVVLLTLPTSASAQVGVALTLGVLLYTLSHFDARGPARQLFVTLCVALVAKYFHWRVSSTLPPMDSPLDFGAALVVLGAELYCVAMLFINVFVVLAPAPSRPRPRLPASAPSVEVFVPSYNEDPELVVHTLAAAKAMIYPADRLVVTLLDDGATEEKLNSPDPMVAEAARVRRRRMMELCDELGVRYLARPRNEMAKAGNLNYGLQHSSADLVVVFDADHAPMRDFLLETVGHFDEDDRLFLVQTPHTFLNPDPIERNLSLNGKAPAENEMFYGIVQRGLDRWNASFFCGSAAVLRRSALEEVGGFAGLSITEDCETALELHSRGWTSRYVDKPLIRGLQPETFAQFIGQRSRWCRGMIQILLLKSPLVRPGLTLAQRICYTSSLLFWLFPIVRLVFVVAPLLYIFFDMRIYTASVNEFFAYTVPYLLAAIGLQSFLFGKYRWPWISEFYEYVQSVYLARAVMSVLANPRAPKFNVTDKGVTLAEDRLSALALPYFLIFATLLAALIYTGYRYETEPASRTLLLVVGGWNVFNLVLAALALGAVAELRERRSRPRLRIGRAAELRLAGESAALVRMEDISQGGCLVRPVHGALPSLGRGATVDVAVEARGGTRTARAIVVNRVTVGHEVHYGLRFDRTDPRRYEFVAELMYGGDAGRSLLPEEQRRRRSIAVWTVVLLGQAARHVLRGLAYLLFRKPRPKQPTAVPSATADASA